MALDDVSVCNMALSAIGSTIMIAALTETSVEAEQCNLWYEPVRDMVFRAAPWNSLSAQQRLALLAERDSAEDWVAADPTPGWTYAFGHPSDMIWPRYTSDYSHFELGFTGTTPTILSNSATPILAYSRRNTTVAQWDIGLRMAVTFALAAHICKGVNGKDSDLQNMLGLAEEKARVARAQDANTTSMSQLPEVVPSWLAARGYGGVAPDTRFIYPPGTISLMSGANLG